jgi:predicted outer membrane repeat protein
MEEKMKSNFVHYVFRFFLLLSFILIPTNHGEAFHVHAPSASVIYVDADVVGGSNNGSSWANAYATLQDALAQPLASGDQIWVAAGIYYPDEGGGQTNNDRSATFSLINGVSILGGFNGTERDSNQRDPDNNITVLSGDIEQDDDTEIIQDPANEINGDNSIHVTTGSSTDQTAVLDGFTITAGNANVVSTGYKGGGMKIIDGNPTLNNLVFAGNRAGYGGGISNKNSAPTLQNVDFIANLALVVGGGMYIFDGSSPSLSDVFFSGNDATNGGGVYNTNNSNTTLLRVTFSGNEVNHNGGGMYNESSAPTLTEVNFTNNTAQNGAGMSNDSGDSSLTEVTFSSNQAIYGGGLYNISNSDSSLTNVSFNDNRADYGGGMYNRDSSPLMTNVLFQGNSAVEYGGGLYNRLSNNLKIINALFSGNDAEFGGGLRSLDSTIVLTNATFSSNNASTDGGGIYLDSTYFTLQNCIIWRNQDSSGTGSADSSIHYTAGNSVTFQYSLVQGWNPGGEGNLDGTDLNNKPLFQNSISPNIAPTTQGDFRLKKTSPAIDIGNNSYVAGISTDLAGNYRIVNQIVDLGAYEANGIVYIPLVMH